MKKCKQPVNQNQNSNLFIAKKLQGLQSVVRSIIEAGEGPPDLL